MIERALRAAAGASGANGLLRDLGWAVVAAALLAIAGRPWGPWWCALLAAAVLWPRLARASPARGAALATVALLPVPGIGYEGLRVHDPAAWWGVTLGVAGAYGATGGTLAWLARRGWPAAPAGWRPWPWIVTWFGLDLLLSHASPWPLPLPVTPGYALVGGPFVALAAFGGPTALGLGWAVLGCGLASALQLIVATVRAPLGIWEPSPAGRPRTPAWGPAAARAWVGGAVALVAVAAGLHAWAAGVPMGPERTLAIVQVAGPVERPADGAAEDLPADEARLAAFASRAAGLRADLHVWPELALGTALGHDASPLARLAEALGAPVLAGAYRRAEDGGWRNAVALGDRHGAAFVVDKRLLVPRYEEWLSPGVGERWPVRAAGWRLGVLVCWESLFVDEAISRGGPDVDLFVVLAHDGWAAGTATPWWHARAARLLAWSAGRPVAFASHDGPSMVWSHDGRLVAATGPGDAALRASVAAPLRPWTPFLAWGADGVRIGWVALALAVAATGRPRPRGQGCGASGPQAA